MILVNLKWKTIFDDISEPGFALSNGNCCANLERLLWNFGIGLCGKFKKKWGYQKWGRFPRVFGDKFGEEFCEKFGDEFSESPNSVIN